MRHILLAVLLIATGTVCQARTIYVDANGTGDYPTIQDAVNDSNNGDVIILQPGTYTGNGNRDIDFLGKAITVRSTDPNDPCIIAETIIDCQEDTINKHRGFKFVTGEDANSILRGITIIDGNAPFENIFGDVNTYGGSVFCYEGSPTIKNCIMKNNSASRGGAIYCGLSAAIIKDCVFMNNTASYHGGAILCRQSQVIISKSSFQSNSATYYGGAIYSKDGNEIIKDCNVLLNQGKYGGGIYSNSAATIQNCIINFNTGFYFGGGIFVVNNTIIKDCIINYNQGLNGGGVDFGYSSDPVITNCIISGNRPIEAGAGGIQVHEGSRARITNCTITNNDSFARYGAIRVVFDSIAIVENCIIWDNTGSGRKAQISVNSSPASIILIYNDIEGGIENISLEFGGFIGLEVGNIDIDPCFADPCNGDYHLLLESPCVNSGDPNYVPEPYENDLDGNPRVRGGRIDMGAYEYPNTLPVADAGPNQVVYAWIDGIAEVTLDGSASYDPDGDELTYLWNWSIDGNTFDTNGVNPTIELPVGVHTISLVVNDGWEDSEPNEVVITVVEPIEGSLWIVPRIINGRCGQQRIIAMLRLPEGISRQQIDAGRKLLLYPGEIEANYQVILRHFEHGRAERVVIFACFDRESLVDAVGISGPVQLDVVGQLKTGQYFYGSDTVRIINPPRRPPRR
jgi:predicted outer membrane repeat protein